jgi:DNA-binding SARP family transcriptional activator
MASLEVRLLGPPAVLWQGNYVSIPRRRARALLYRLAADLRPVARAHLVDLFWSCESDAAAHRDLTHLLTHLRRALPCPDLLQTTADFIFLNPTLAWSDTRHFVALFRPPHTYEDAAVLEQAAELYQGPFLDGFGLDGCPEFEEWATVERSAWDYRYQAVLAALVRENRKAGNLDLAITCAQRYLALNPADLEMGQTLADLEQADAENARRLSALRSSLALVGSLMC